MLLGERADACSSNSEREASQITALGLSCESNVLTTNLIAVLVLQTPVGKWTIAARFPDFL